MGGLTGMPHAEEDGQRGKISSSITVGYQQKIVGFLCHGVSQELLYRKEPNSVTCSKGSVVLKG